MIQIDMEMPETCSRCPFFDYNGDYPTCIVTQHSMGYTFQFKQSKMDDCPIQDVESNRNEYRTLRKLFNMS